MNQYTHFTPLSQPDVYTAVYNFVQTLALPALHPGNIIRGWQNRNHLPENSNEFCIITVLNVRRRGTNVQHFTFDPATEVDGVLTSSELVEVPVQLDFCANNDTARQRAQAVELVGRSPLAVAFFKPYSISPLYAEEVRDLSHVDGSEQFVQRFTVTLNLSFWASVTASVGWFDHVNLYTENVDVHHHPEA